MGKFFRTVIHLHIFYVVTHAKMIFDMVEHEAKEATIFHIVEFGLEKGWQYGSETIATLVIHK